MRGQLVRVPFARTGSQLALVVGQPRDPARVFLRKWSARGCRFTCAQSWHRDRVIEWLPEGELSRQMAEALA